MTIACSVNMFTICQRTMRYSMERGRETVGAVHSRYSGLCCLQRKREEKKELEKCISTQSYSNCWGVLW